MIDLKTVVLVSGLYYEREIDDELIFFSESGKEIHTLEETARFIYKSIDNKKTISEIVDELCAEYDVTPEVANDDVISFINDLLDKKILKVKDR